MSLLDAVRAGVAVAHSVTKPLQATVIYKQCTAVDSRGKLTFGSDVSLTAVVDGKRTMIKSPAGQLIQCKAMLTFLDINALLAATNNLGIQTNDSIVLPDGTTGPILNIGGFIDAGTGVPVASEVAIG